MIDYKEKFQEYYDEAKEEGMDDERAGEYADDMLSDFFAGLADTARDEAKCREG